MQISENWKPCIYWMNLGEAHGCTNPDSIGDLMKRKDAKKRIYAPLSSNKYGFCMHMEYCSSREEEKRGD
jgi:hypothetical protein